MSVRWLSINDVRRLINEKIYALENGTIFDRKKGEVVGQMRGNNFHQDPDYRIPTYVVKLLDAFCDDDWNDSSDDW